MPAHLQNETLETVSHVIEGTQQNNLLYTQFRFSLSLNTSLIR